MTMKAHFSSTLRIIWHIRGYMQKTNKKTPIFIRLDFSQAFYVKQTLFLKKQVTNAVGKCRQDCKYCKSASPEKPNLNCESPCDLVVNKDFNRGRKSIMSNRCPL